MPPAAGLVLDLEMNGVVTGGGTYPDDTCEGRQRREKCLRGGCGPRREFQPSAFPHCPAFPAFLLLTRALKGSFLVMSSSSEDRESISRSMLLTFSLGYRGRGQSAPSQFPTATPSARRAEMSPDRRERTLLLLPWGCDRSSCPSRASYLRWELGGGLRTSLLHYGGRWGREDLLVQRRGGKRFLDRGRRRWEGTSQGALGVICLPDHRRRR